MSDRPEISIVTPSFRGGRWLPLCIASVADQPVCLEHIVQDAVSDDGTIEWLTKDTRVRAYVESDQGMYDAVNRGYRRAQADIVAYLNCDEQYLPHALPRVVAFFRQHPEVDILFGDCLVVNANGEYICERRSLTPQLIHTWTASNLSFLTAVTFLRRRVLDAHQLWFNADYRDAGDQDWALRVTQAGVRTAVLPEFLSVFTETGANMNLGAECLARASGFPCGSAVLGAYVVSLRTGASPTAALACGTLSVSASRLRHFHAKQPTKADDLSGSESHVSVETRSAQFSGMKPFFTPELLNFIFPGLALVS